MDFNSIDLETCELLKLITENLGIFGPFDDLTNKRIIYFNNKIEKLKKSQPVRPIKTNISPSSTNIMPIPQDTHTVVNTNVNTKINKNFTNIQGNTGNLDLPEAGKGNSNAKKERQVAEDAIDLMKL